MKKSRFTDSQIIAVPPAGYGRTTTSARIWRSAASRLP